MLSTLRAIKMPANADKLYTRLIRDNNLNDELFTNTGFMINLTHDFVLDKKINIGDAKFLTAICKIMKYDGIFYNALLHGAPYRGELQALALQKAYQKVNAVELPIYKIIGKKRILVQFQDAQIIKMWHDLCLDYFLTIWRSNKDTDAIKLLFSMDIETIKLNAFYNKKHCQISFKIASSEEAVMACDCFDENFSAELQAAINIEITKARSEAVTYIVHKKMHLLLTHEIFIYLTDEKQTLDANKTLIHHFIDKRIKDNTIFSDLHSTNDFLYDIELESQLHSSRKIYFYAEILNLKSQLDAIRQVAAHFAETNFQVLDQDPNPLIRNILNFVGFLNTFGLTDIFQEKIPALLSSSFAKIRSDNLTYANSLSRNKIEIQFFIRLMPLLHELRLLTKENQLQSQQLVNDWVKNFPFSLITDNRTHTYNLRIYLKAANLARIPLQEIKTTFLDWINKSKLMITEQHLFILERLKKLNLLNDLDIVNSVINMSHLEKDRMPSLGHLVIIANYLLDQINPAIEMQTKDLIAQKAKSIIDKVLNDKHNIFLPVFYLLFHLKNLKMQFVIPQELIEKFLLVANNRNLSYMMRYAEHVKDILEFIDQANLMKKKQLPTCTFFSKKESEYAVLESKSVSSGVDVKREM